MISHYRVKIGFEGASVRGACVPGVPGVLWCKMADSSCRNTWLVTSGGDIDAQCCPYCSTHSLAHFIAHSVVYL